MREYIIDNSSNWIKCFPKDLDTTDFIEINKIGHRYAEFYDPNSGKTHNCKKYYNEYLKESEIHE